MRKLFFISFVLLVLTLPSTSVRAEQPPGLIITPATQQLIVANGSGQTRFGFEIGNYTSTAQELHLQISDFMAGGGNNNAAQFTLSNQNTSNRFGLAAWANLDQSSVILQPNQTKLITVRINDDASLLPGGHYGALIATTKNSQPYQNSQKVELVQGLSGLIFLTKTGGESYGLQLTDAKSTQSLVGETATLSLRFQNTGNVHVVPRGIAQVFDSRGKLLSQGIINVDSDILLPETNKIEVAQLHSLAQVHWPGKYTLVIRYHREGDDTPATSTISFLYAPPYQIVILLLFLFLTAVAFMRRLLHRRKSGPRA